MLHLLFGPVGPVQAAGVRDALPTVAGVSGGAAVQHVAAAHGLQTGHTNQKYKLESQVCRGTTRDRNRAASACFQDLWKSIRKIWHQNSFYQNSDLNICVEIRSLLRLSSIKPNFKLIIGTRKSSTTSGNVRIWRVVSYMRIRAAAPRGRWRPAAGLVVTAARLFVALDVLQQGLVVRQTQRRQREGLHLVTGVRGRVTGETLRAAVQLVWAANSLKTRRRFRKEPDDTADVCQEQPLSFCGNSVFNF